MTKDEASVNALIRELSEQRGILGNRSAQMAASNAALAYENEELKKRIAELEKKPEPEAPV
jgi:regulator of replication initiation timing